MNAFLTIVLLATVSISQAAVRNPLIRVCHQKLGQFYVHDVKNLDFAVCYFDESYLGALDLVQWSNGESRLAIEALLSGSTAGKNCKDMGANLMQGHHSEGSYSVCRFSDGSTLDSVSLKRGLSHPKNSKLVKALK